MSTNSWHQYSIIKLLQHRIIFLVYIRLLGLYSCVLRALRNPVFVNFSFLDSWKTPQGCLNFEQVCKLEVLKNMPMNRSVSGPSLSTNSDALSGVWKTMRCLKFKVQLFQWFRYVFEKRFCDLRGREAERLGVAHSSLNTPICKVSRTRQVCHRTLPRWGLRVMEFSDSIADAVGTFRGLFQSSIWVLSIPH